MSNHDMSGRHDLESRLRRHLDVSAGSVGSPALDLDGVRRRGRRRRNMVRSAAATTSVVALVAVGLVTLRVTGGDGDEGFTVDGGTPVAESAPDSGPDASAGPMGDPATVTTTVPVPGVPVSGVPIEVPGAARSVMVTETGAQIARWNGGYVRVETVWGQQIIGPLPDDVIALFSPEVVEFFADGAPANVQEGLDALADRPDLLAEIERVIAEHPAAYDAILGGPSSSSLLVDTSPDGVAWQRVGELDLPDGVDQIGQLRAQGDRLVMVGSSWGMTDTGPLTRTFVVSTTDLQTWDTVHELEPADPGTVPAGFRLDSWVSGFDTGPAGVVVVVSDMLQFEVEELVPAEIRDEILQNGAGYGTSIGTAGVTIELLGEGREITAPGPDGTEIVGWEEGEVLATHSFTWDELGVDPDVAMSPPSGAAVWSGDVVDGLVRSDIGDLGTDHGWIDGVVALDGAVALTVSTETGPKVWYSTDGVSWSDRTPPVDEQVHALHLGRTSDGLLLITGGPGGSEVWISDAAVEGWERGDASVLSADPTGERGEAYVALSSWDSTGFAAVLSFDPASRNVPDDVAPIVIERDGYRLTRSIIGGSVSAELVRVGEGDSPDEVVLVGEDAFDSGGHVAWSDDGTVTFLDPATGDPLVTFTADDVEAAVAAVPGDDPTLASSQPWHPTFVVVETDDGRSWRVLDVIEPEPRPEPVDGDVVAAVPIDGNWPTALVITPDEVLFGLGGGIASTEYRIYDR